VRPALYRWLEQHRWAGDGILAVLLLIVLSVNLFGTVPYFRDGGVGGWVLGLSWVPLLVRRTLPEIALVTSCALLLLNLRFLGTPTPAVLLVPVMVHAAVVYCHRKVWARAALVLGLIGSVLGPLRWGYYNFEGSLRSETFVLAMAIGFCGITVIAAFVLGERRRDRQDHQAEQLRALTERTHLLAAERDQRASIAAAAERARIARELHDIVAHSLSVVIVQADGAAAAVANHPELAQSVLGTIAETSREALAEMRQLVGVLRTDPAGPERAGYVPAQGLADLPALVEQVRQAGAEVRLTIEGQPQPVPAGLALTVYRLVQEALTNVLKHAGPFAQAQVILTHSVDFLAIAVVDRGRGSALSSGENGGGHGLLGMRERVSLQGGQLIAGPQSGGGFRVAASFALNRTSTWGRA